MLKIQDFKFIRTIGTGAFGKVYLVSLRNDSKNDSKNDLKRSDSKPVFAIKMLNFRELLRQRLVDQLENEMSIQKQLYGCPFVAKLFSTDFHNGNVGLILEYVGGGELFHWLKRCGRFDEHTTRFYAAELVCALRFIHLKGVLYRDLKPENILISSTGHIKLVDFGFAVYENESIYMISGTPEYMSPEKLKNGDDGRASDYWGLGIMMYEMLCGDPPFYDPNADVIYHKISDSQVIFPDYMSCNARNIITGLLDKIRTSRLGSRGIEEIMNHPFFENINWEDVENRRTQPPFIPRIEEPSPTAKEINIEENGTDVNVLRPYKHINPFQRDLRL